MCLKCSDGTANGVGPNQTASVVTWSGSGLHCLLRSFHPNIIGKCGITLW